MIPAPLDLSGMRGGILVDEHEERWEYIPGKWELAAMSYDKVMRDNDPGVYLIDVAKQRDQHIIQLHKIVMQQAGLIAKLSQRLSQESEPEREKGQGTL